MSAQVEAKSNTTETPARKMLLSPIDLTPPSSTKKRALGELSINLPARPHSAQDYTTPDHSDQHKKYRKVSEPLTAPLSAGLPSSAPQSASQVDDAVWGPAVSKAFMEALERFPKLGRRKVFVFQKSCGRNELIAEYIFRRTGKVRSRKQVSSHIQVLKHLRRDDKKFMALVNDHPIESQPDVEEKDETADFEALLVVSPLREPPTPVSSSQPAKAARPAELSPLCQITRTRTPVIPRGPAKGIQFEDFSIWATSKQPDQEHVVTSVVYTKLRSTSQIPTSPLEDLFNWPSRFPMLSQILSDPSNAQCPVFRLRAGLKLPKQLDLEGEAQVVLRTHLSLLALLRDKREAWACSTRVYTMGNMVLELPQRIAMDCTETVGETNKPSVEGLASVPFATDFWAAFLAGLSTNAGKGDDDDELARKSERDAEIAVAGVTMTQQIATIETALEPSRPICLLLWEFDLCTGSRPGETTVMRIAVPPPKPIAAARPAPMIRAASMSQTMPRLKPVRPRLATAGLPLQRSVSMAAVPTQPAKRLAEFIPYHGPNGEIKPAKAPATTPSSAAAARKAAVAWSMPPAPSHLQAQPPVYHQHYRAPPPARLQMPQAQQPAHALAYYPGHYEDMSSPATMLQNPMSQYTATPPPMHLVASVPGSVVNGGAPPMARSFSAPSWQPSSDMLASPWDGSFIDWTLPESAGYLQADFEIADDDCFGTVEDVHVMPPPAVETLVANPPISTAQDVFLAKAPVESLLPPTTTTSAPSRADTADLDAYHLIDAGSEFDDGLPKLGFFPLQN